MCLLCMKRRRDVAAVVDTRLCGRCARPHAGRAACGVCDRHFCSACDELLAADSTPTAVCCHLDNGVAAADVGSVHVCGGVCGDGEGAAAAGARVLLVIEAHAGRAKKAQRRFPGALVLHERITARVSPHQRAKVLTHKNQDPAP